MHIQYTVTCAFCRRSNSLTKEDFLIVASVIKTHNKRKTFLNSLSLFFNSTQLANNISLESYFHLCDYLSGYYFTFKHSHTRTIIHGQSAKQTTHAITFAPDSQLDMNKNVEMEIDSYNVQLFDFYLLTITIIVVFAQKV